jgi:hypothetical protein
MSTLKSILPLVVLAIPTFSTCVRGNPPDRMPLALTISNAWSVRIGMSLEDCRKRISWTEVQAGEVDKMFQLEPFWRRLSFTRPEVVSAWTDSKTNTSGWPNYLMAIFSSHEKGALVDFFLISDGDPLPLVVGRYETFLKDLTAGTKMTRVFENLGRPLCDYYLKKDGTWGVSFLYGGFRSRFFRIEVDAASGTVLTVRDVTL